MKIIDSAIHPIKAWIDHVSLEPEVEQQLKNLASLPVIYRHIAVMPDVHFGKGATVGTVIATKNSLIPAAVGVDIGCGMMGVKLPFKITILKNLSSLRHTLERSLAVGKDCHPKPLPWLNKVRHLHRSDVNEKTWQQFGTLGGGNHFVEISGDENQDAWVIVHSGSRGVGHHLAVKHIQKAKEKMGEKIYTLADPDLAWLPEGTPEFEHYLRDLMWAEEYARYNREAMMDLILKDIAHYLSLSPEALAKECGYWINCAHNYSRLEQHFGHEVWITRKGAISAKKGEYGIIPGSMGERSFIVKGKGHPESFTSCSHGAGRLMSRARAKKLYSPAALKQQTEGVECRKDQGVVDEIPAAYKNIDDVMRSQQDLIEIVFTLKQRICIKE